VIFVFRKLNSGLVLFALTSSSGTQLCFWSPECGVYWCLCGTAAPSMCIWVVLEISHAGAQLASLGFMNLKSNNVVCQTVFAILMLQKLLLVVSRFVFFLTLGFPDMVFWFASFPLIGNVPL